MPRQIHHALKSCVWMYLERRRRNSVEDCSPSVASPGPRSQSFEENGNEGEDGPQTEAAVQQQLWKLATKHLESS